MKKQIQFTPEKVKKKKQSSDDIPVTEMVVGVRGGQETGEGRL